MIRCKFCGSLDIIKNGKRKCKDGEHQKYCCKDCKRRFVEVNAAYVKSMVIMLDLYERGLSSRQIEDHLRKCHNIRLDHSTIIRRINKLQ